MSRPNPFSGGIEAGRLTDRLVFELRILTLNAVGQYVESWGPGFTEWGEAQRQSEQNCRFIIRWRDGITPATYRILYFDSIWTINNAVPDRKRTILIIDSDFSQLIEVTHMRSTDREYIEGLPIVRPPE